MGYCVLARWPFQDSMSSTVSSNSYWKKAWKPKWWGVMGLGTKARRRQSFLTWLCLVALTSPPKSWVSAISAGGLVCTLLCVWTGVWALPLADPGRVRVRAARDTSCTFPSVGGGGGLPICHLLFSSSRSLGGNEGQSYSSSVLKKPEA